VLGQNFNQSGMDEEVVAPAFRVFKDLPADQQVLRV
jgi:hypothetical protein